MYSINCKSMGILTDWYNDANLTGDLSVSSPIPNTSQQNFSRQSGIVSAQHVWMLGYLFNVRSSTSRDRI
jgi:hypothetical protein